MYSRVLLENGSSALGYESHIRSHEFIARVQGIDNPWLNGIN